MLEKMILLDTDILIDLGRNRSQAVAYLKSLEGKCLICISVLTEMECIAGCRNEAEVLALFDFKHRFIIITLNQEVCIAAVDLLNEYRVEHCLTPADAFIAATALAIDIPLATKRPEAYACIPELTLLPYPPSAAAAPAPTA